MEEAILALKQLLESAINETDSPLEDVQRVYFGDPILIPQNLLPAITLMPIETEYSLRGTRYDEKTGQIEVRIVYNQKDYYEKNENTAITATNATYSGGYITYTTTTAHNLSDGDSVLITGIDPDEFNLTGIVDEVIDSTNFKVAKTLSSTPTYASGGSIKEVNDDKVFLVQKALRMAEKSGSTDSQKTATNSVCGVVESSLCLPYTNGGSTIYTASLARITNVRYTFSKARGFPTFEVVCTLQAHLIGDRN